MNDDDLRKRLVDTKSCTEGGLAFCLNDDAPPDFHGAAACREDIAAVETILQRLPPADDGLKVTADWLRSVGGLSSRVAGRVLLVHPDDPGFVVAVAFDGAEPVTWSIIRTCERVSLDGVPTRGDVRRLCGLLGIAMTPAGGFPWCAKHGLPRGDGMTCNHCGVRGG